MDFVKETLDMNQISIKADIHVAAVFENTPFELKVDSDAKCNVISTSTIKSLSLCKKHIWIWKGKLNIIKTIGKCVLNCNVSDVRYLTSQVPLNSKLYAKIRNQSLIKKRRSQTESHLISSRCSRN